MMSDEEVKQHCIDVHNLRSDTKLSPRSIRWWHQRDHGIFDVHGHPDHEHDIEDLGPKTARKADV